MALILTGNAIEIIKDIVSGSGEAAQVGGIRVVAAETRDESAVGLQLSVAELPAADDHVVEQDGARLFLERRAARILDDKVLDAMVEDGRMLLILTDQL